MRSFVNQFSGRALAAFNAALVTLLAIAVGSLEEITEALGYGVVSMMVVSILLTLAGLLKSLPLILASWRAPETLSRWDYVSVTSAWAAVVLEIVLVVSLRGSFA
jgi:hypothetical protein